MPNQPVALKIKAVGMVFSLLLATWNLSAQDALPYLLTTENQLEVVGFPIHQPAVDAGTVSAVKGPLVYWSPSFTDRPFGSALRPGQEYYVEVVGPVGHSWLGHRFELDETSTRARTDHVLVTLASAYNTRGIPDSSLAGARLEIRPHLTVDGLWGETIRDRVLYGGEPATSFTFSLPAPGTVPGTLSVTPSLQRPSDPLEWMNSLAQGVRITEPLLIPPGTAVVVTLGQRRGSSLSLTAEPRAWPTAAPLQSGVNLLAYPYPKDLRLGIDWGSSREGFKGSAKPFPGQDRLEIWAGKNRRSFAPETQASGGVRWRLLNPTTITRDWAQPPTYLDRIPPGQGFLLRKSKADSLHFFYPPQP